MKEQIFKLEPGSLYYKPDWQRAKRRWVAFWDCQNTDRPLIDVTAPRIGPSSVPEMPRPENLESIYFDPGYILQFWLRVFESVYFGGEGFPAVGYLMGGYALGCGCAVHFAPETVWHLKTMGSIYEPLGWHPGQDDLWRQKLDRVVSRLLDAAPGKFLVGYVCQTMVNDLLALIRGVDDFMVDLALDMNQCVRQLEKMFDLWADTFEHYRNMIDERQKAWHDGCAWTTARLWHPEFFMISQSDISCMISEEMFERYVVRELECVADRYTDCIWYHLDGPGAIKHLPRLLSKPYIRAVQWVPGAGQLENGPAWMDLYREVQRANKCLDLSVQSQDNVEYLIRHLRPEGLIIRTDAASQQQADELIQNAIKWCGSHLHSNL